MFRYRNYICLIVFFLLFFFLQLDANPTKGSPTDPVRWLDRLATIFRHTNPSADNGSINSCSAVFTEIWPVISQTCNKFQSDVRVIERSCRCLRFAVRCSRQQSAHLLQPIVQQVTKFYFIILFN